MTPYEVSVWKWISLRLFQGLTETIDLDTKNVEALADWIDNNTYTCPNGISIWAMAKKWTDPNKREVVHVSSKFTNPDFLSRPGYRSPGRLLVKKTHEAWTLLALESNLELPEWPTDMTIVNASLHWVFPLPEPERRVLRYALDLIPREKSHA